MRRGSSTTLWFTLSPSTTKLTEQTILDIRKIRTKVQTHAHTFWGYSKSEVEGIVVSKLDVAKDLYGSFMSESPDGAIEDIKQVLKDHITDVLNCKETNFVSTQNIGPVTVKLGSNIIPSCYQYTVHDQHKRKILTVKLYDKIIDLVSRDG